MPEPAQLSYPDDPPPQRPWWRSWLAPVSVGALALGFGIFTGFALDNGDESAPTRLVTRTAEGQTITVTTTVTTTVTQTVQGPSDETDTEDPIVPEDSTGGTEDPIQPK